MALAEIPSRAWMATWAYSPDEARDAHGRFVSGGAKGKSPATHAAERAASAYREGQGAADVRGVSPALQARAQAVSARLGGGGIDLTGVDPANQAGTIAALERFNGRYPAVSVRVQALDPTSITGNLLFGGKENAGVLAVTDPQGRSSTIYLNNDYFKSQSSLAQAVHGSVVHGFLSHGVTDPADHAVTHELGHSLSIDAGMGARHAPGGITPFDREMTPVIESALFTDENIKGISRYATENLAEFVAESFANTDSPSRLAAEVQSALNRAYSRSHGRYREGVAGAAVALEEKELYLPPSRAWMATWAFNPDQARDAHGRFVSSGAKGRSPATRAAGHLAEVHRSGSAVAAKVKNVSPELQARAEALSRGMGGQTINLSGVDPRLQPGVVGALENFHQAYPAVRVEVVAGRPESPLGRVMIDDPNDTMAATARNVGNPEAYKAGETVSSVFLNDRFFSNADLMADTMSMSIRAGFLTRGPVGARIGTDRHGAARMDPAEQTVTHELGHALANSLSAGAPSSPYEHVLATVGNSRLLSNQAAEDISKYATQSEGEFFAEALTQAQGPVPSPLASLVKSTADSAYHARFG